MIYNKHYSLFLLLNNNIKGCVIGHKEKPAFIYIYILREVNGELHEPDRFSTSN